MNDKTKTGLRILQVAAILGITGDILLRQTPWGLNVFLFNMLFVAGTATLIIKRRSADLVNGQTIALLAAQIFFSAMFVLRDSIQLRVADTFAILSVISVLIVPKFKIAPRVAGVFHYFAGFVWSAFNAWFAPFILLCSDIKWKKAPDSGWSRHAVSVLRGLAIVAPILFIFGGLFVAADAVYQGMVERVFNIEPQTIITHTLLFAAFSWMSAGYLRGIVFGNDKSKSPANAEAPASARAHQPGPASNAEARASVREEQPTRFSDDAPFLPDFRTAVEHINISDPPDPPVAEARASDSKAGVSATDDHSTQAQAEPSGIPLLRFDWAHIDNSFLPSFFTLGTIEIILIFGLIDLLFLSFVIVQIPYLFGGMELVQNTPDFKLAAYARRGFGELVTVSALVLPILLSAHWLIRKDSPLASKLFRILARVQIVLLFVIMASATQRLLLLTGELGYGMTTVRLYPMVFMTWLAIVFVWFSLTVLRGSRQYFAWGALWSAFVILGCTNLLNPDAFIARTNLALMEQGREFDASYNAGSLSTDAIPALLDAMPKMSIEDQCKTKSELHIRYWELGKDRDLRSLNYSRKSAFYLLRHNDTVLHDREGCPAWMQLPSDE